jgi:hypothetical protein
LILRTILLDVLKELSKPLADFEDVFQYHVFFSFVSVCYRPTLTKGLTRPTFWTVLLSIHLKKIWLE